MLKDKQDFFLIDVREPEEYEAGAIAGAILMPLETVSEKMKGIKHDKKLVLYCQRGSRSRMAGEELKKVGFESVFSLKGGYEAWLEENN